MSLTHDQVATFQERGWLAIKGLLEPADFAPMLNEFDTVIETMAAKLKASGQIQDDGAHEGFRTRLTTLTRQTPEAFRALFSGMHNGKELFEFLRHPKVLDVMESLLGPEIACHPAYRVRPKLPDLASTKRLTVVPWHQDSAYRDPKTDDDLMITIWVSLTESTVENGCLELIDRAHPAMLPHRNVRNQTYLRILHDALPAHERIQCVTEPGDVILMTQKTPHRSVPNTTDQIRWSIDMRYHRAGTPTGYPPEAGFVARSRENPDSVCNSAEEFAAIRTAHEAGRSWRWKRWPMHEKL